MLKAHLQWPLRFYEIIYCLILVSLADYDSLDDWRTWMNSGLAWTWLDLAVDDLRHRGFWTFLWMISASGLHRGWTPWTQEWACKSVDHLLRFDLTINFHKFHHHNQPHKHQHPLPLPAAHPPHHIILPFVSRHHLFLFIRDKSLKVYPNRKLFSSWKVCKCKTAPPSSEGEQNHLNVETEKHNIHKYINIQIHKYTHIPQRENKTGEI